MNDELDELTKDDEVEEQAEVTTEAEATEETTAEATEDAVKGEQAAATPAASGIVPADHVPTAALLDERAKRQELERKLQALEAQAEASQRPDPTEDPAGAIAYTESQMAELLSQNLRQTSRIVAMGKYGEDDYIAKEKQFMAMMESNPALADAMMSHPNPAAFAYETARKADELKAMENVDEYKAKLEAEVREKVRAELEAESQASAAKNAEVAAAAGIPSLATATGTGGHATPTDESLDDILAR